MGEFRSSEVDLEADPAVVQHKVDHSSQDGETRRVSDGEHAGALETQEYLPQVRRLRSRDEQNLASPGLRNSVGMGNLNAMAVHGLVHNHLFEVTAKWILAKHADLQRGIGAGKGVGRPFHESCEVEQERGLDLILGGGLRLGNGGEQAQEDTEQGPFPARRKSSLTCPWTLTAGHGHWV